MILKQFSLYIVVNLSLHVQEVTLKLFSVQLVQEAMLFLEEVLELFLLVDVREYPNTGLDWTGMEWNGIEYWTLTRLSTAVPTCTVYCAAATDLTWRRGRGNYPVFI